MSKAPRRWIVVSLVMIILSLVTIGSAVYTVTVAQKSNRQAAEIVALMENAKAADNLRASERQAAKLRSQSECRSALKGTKQATIIIEGLRSTYLELAGESLNPLTADTLRQRAKQLPVFPRPQCDPGKKT